MVEIVTKVNMKMQIYKYLRQEILNQNFKAGERINLDELCRTLKVSNTPVRECISLLEQEGLIVNKPNVGFFVTNPTLKEMFDIAQVLLFFLLGAYEYCVTQNSISRILEGMEKELANQKKWLESKDLISYVEHTHEFERNIILATDNENLLGEYDKMSTMAAFMASYFSNKSVETSYKFYHQHEEIYELIKENKTEEVIKKLKEHYYKSNIVPENIQRLY